MSDDILVVEKVDPKLLWFRYFEQHFYPDWIALSTRTNTNRSTPSEQVGCMDVAAIVIAEIRDC